MVDLSVTCELAALTEAFKRANNVQPNMKDNHYAAIGGVMLEIDVDSNAMTIYATDYNVWYREEFQAVTGIEGGASGILRYRLPVRILYPFLSSKKAKAGSRVTLEFTIGTCEVTIDRAVCTTGILPTEHYPSWGPDPFAPDDWVKISDLGRVLGQVEYAASAKATHYGVQVTSSWLGATDRSRAAMVDFAPTNIQDGGFVIPARVLTGVINAMGECDLCLDGKTLLLRPDEFTLVKVGLIDLNLPNIKGLLSQTFPNPSEFTVDKSAIIDIVQRAAKIGKDEAAIVQLIVGEEEIAAYMIKEQGVDSIGDVFDVPGQVLHDRTILHVHSTFLVEALSNAPADEVTFHFNIETEETAHKPRFVKIVCGDYTAMIAQRHAPAKDESND